MFEFRSNINRRFGDVKIALVRSFCFKPPKFAGVQLPFVPIVWIFFQDCSSFFPFDFLKTQFISKNNESYYFNDNKCSNHHVLHKFQLILKVYQVAKKITCGWLAAEKLDDTALSKRITDGETFRWIGLSEILTFCDFVSSRIPFIDRFTGFITFKNLH